MSLLNRLLKTFRRTEHFDDIAEELDFHRDAMQRSLESQGVDPVDARRQVAARFGSAAKLREETREAHIIPAIENWLRDIRLAWRSLAKQPALVATAVASLAAGIGATAAVFSVADAVFLKPLPLPRPENLYVL